MTILTKRPISHDEANEALGRLINSHFHKEPHARVSIPARIDHDDDLVLSAYVEQQRAKDAARARGHKNLDEEIVTSGGDRRPVWTFYMPGEGAETAEALSSGQ